MAQAEQQLPEEIIVSHIKTYEAVCDQIRQAADQQIAETRKHLKASRAELARRFGKTTAARTKVDEPEERPSTDSAEPNSAIWRYTWEEMEGKCRAGLAMARYYQDADFDTILHCAPLDDSWPLKNYYTLRKSHPQMSDDSPLLEVLAAQMFIAGYEAARITGGAPLRKQEGECTGREGVLLAFPKR